MSFAMIGASHMRRIIPHILAKGFPVVDLTEQGWTLNTKNTQALSHLLPGVVDSPGCVLVMDLFGRTSTRFRQEDDSLSLAVKVGGGWHMPGDVMPIEDGPLTTQVSQVCSALDLGKGGPKIVLPPIPRYMFGGCCTNPTHAPNTRDENHGHNTLTNHIKHRKTIIKTLSDTGCKHFKVLDFISTYTQDHTLPSQKIDALRRITDRDNVHLTQEGYAKLADKIIHEAEALTTTHKQLRNTPSKHKPGSKNWRGFIYTEGVGRASSGSGLGPRKQERGGNRNHPYRR